MLNNMGDERLRADSEFVFALRLDRKIREVLVVKIDTKENVYVFPPYTRIAGMAAACCGIADEPHVDVHVSRHASGERHFIWKIGGTPVPMRETIVKLEPMSRFSGAELLIHAIVLKGEFVKLPPTGSNSGDLVILDADSAGFRDDLIVIRAFLISAGKEHEIQPPPNRGRYVRHIQRDLTPWLAVEAYQEAMPS